MAGYELKKQSDVAIANSAEGAKVLIEQDGEIKRIDSNDLSNGSGLPEGGAPHQQLVYRCGR